MANILVCSDSHSDIPNYPKCLFPPKTITMSAMIKYAYSYYLTLDLSYVSGGKESCQTKPLGFFFFNDHYAVKSPVDLKYEEPLLHVPLSILRGSH